MSPPKEATTYESFILKQPLKGDSFATIKTFAAPLRRMSALGADDGEFACGESLGSANERRGSSYGRKVRSGAPALSSAMAWSSHARILSLLAKASENFAIDVGYVRRSSVAAW